MIVKVAFWPAFTVWFVVCVVMVGTVLTVSTAPSLVAEPAALAATIKYVPALLSPLLVIVYEVPVAPKMFVPFICHW